MRVATAAPAAHDADVHVRHCHIHAVDIALLKSVLTQSVNVMRWPVKLVLLHVPRHQVNRNQRVLEIPAMR